MKNLKAHTIKATNTLQNKSNTAMWLDIWLG